MSPKMLSKIESAIQDFIDTNCEADFFQSFTDGNYIHTQLAAQMALASYTVLKSAIDAQKFAADQNG